MNGDPGVDTVVLQLVARSQESAFDRFVLSLPATYRWEAEETVRLHEEMVEHTRRALNDPTAEALAHAAWLAKFAGEVAYRWSVLRTAYVKWAERDVRPIVVRIA